MERVSLEHARRRLGELVRAAERGESILITRHGKPVARLVPADERPRRHFPNLDAFRRSIRLKGQPISRTVSDQRGTERS